MDNADIRISQAERERAADVLKAAHAEQRLTTDELTERLDQLFNQAKTYRDVWDLVCDLPGGTAVVPPAMPPAPYLAYPPAPRPARSDVNGFAIVSLVASLVSPVTLGLGSIGAVVFGHIAKAQIKGNGERGTGLAVAGLTLGYLGIGVVSFLLLLGAILAK